MERGSEVVCFWAFWSMRWLSRSDVNELLVSNEASAWMAFHWFEIMGLMNAVSSLVIPIWSMWASGRHG